MYTRRQYTYLLIAAGLSAAIATLVWTGRSSATYLSVRPSVSQTFTAIPNEQSLVDLCYRLRQVQGVTGVSYRDYSLSQRSAVVTVFYNPSQTSVRQLKVFLQHSRILWAQPARA